MIGVAIVAAFVVAFFVGVALVLLTGKDERYLPSRKHGQFDATPADEERHGRECSCRNET